MKSPVGTRRMSARKEPLAVAGGGSIGDWVILGDYASRRPCSGEGEAGGAAGVVTHSYLKALRGKVAVSGPSSVGGCLLLFVECVGAQQA